jgi:hypothetical protein
MGFARPAAAGMARPSAVDSRERRRTQGASVIVHINHIATAKKKSQLGDLASLVTGSLVNLVEDGILDSRIAPSLRIHLDWIQYKTNFRDPVMIRRTTNPEGQPLALAEIAIDLRQADPSQLPTQLAHAVRTVPVGPQTTLDERRVYLDHFRPYRDCMIWDFNRLFWTRLADWEAASGRGFEAALPSGKSDANHPEAVADSVTEFWTLLHDLDARKQLPPEILALEIGVGTGMRARAWMDGFKALDAERGTNYYAKLHFILGDYSMTSLERAVAAVSHHTDHVSAAPLDALNPFKALASHRFKVMYVHLTNVYDNLPFDDLVRRDGHLYLVEVRAYVSGATADRIAAEFGVGCDDLPKVVDRLIADGPAGVFPGGRGVAFWRCLWDGFKLEERLRALAPGEDAHVPPGLSFMHFEDLLAEAPEDIRFHISRGAAESFANTLPLLHPRGYLQVQDIFVEHMDDYRRGFRGPGKLDGSLVTWVNGAMLRVVGARAGYDVHFAPFPYRPGTKTTIMYTTQRP